MWINKNKYDRLKQCEDMLRECTHMKHKLEEEVKRLADAISDKVEDCKVGFWCKDCKYVGYDHSEIKDYDTYGDLYIREVAGKVQYCKKHLHEVCPEFERKV